MHIGIATLPHRQKYVAERDDEDKIVPFQLYGPVAPVFRLAFEPPTLTPITNSRLHRKAVRTGSVAGREKKQTS